VEQVDQQVKGDFGDDAQIGLASEGLVDVPDHGAVLVGRLLEDVLAEGLELRVQLISLHLKISVNHFLYHSRKLIQQRNCNLT